MRRSRAFGQPATAAPPTRLPSGGRWTYSGNKLHPTQKPLTVLLPLVETFSAAAGLVLDPFAGSGSTLLAAKQLGRSWLGIELSAEYHAVAERRLGMQVTAPVAAASPVP